MYKSYQDVIGIFFKSIFGGAFCAPFHSAKDYNILSFIFLSDDNERFKFNYSYKSGCYLT